MIEKRMSIPASKIRYKEFSYRKPIIRQITRGFIKRDFFEMDDEEKKIAYYCASHGIGNEMEVPELPYDELVDILVRKREEWKESIHMMEYSVQVWLMNNEYTRAKRPKMKGYFTLTMHNFFNRKEWPSEIVLEVDKILRA